MQSKFPVQKQNILTSSELQNHEKIYADAEELLNTILNNKEYKHSKHIRFLASQHESQIMKIRFVLQPFSLIFLLTGEQNYHIILETLDTEEATYIWHTQKSKEALRSNIKAIDNQLLLIKEKGRQAFLDTNPENFSKVLHDYFENSKGFIVWKGLLEEIIY